MDQNKLPVKVAGRKGKPKVGLETANGFLPLSAVLIPHWGRFAHGPSDFGGPIEESGATSLKPGV